MIRKLSKPLLAILVTGVLLIGAAGLAVANGNFFFVGSTNTVTQVNYATATATSVVTTTGTETVTGTPFETLTTVTASGTQTYTSTITQTTGATATSTVTANTDYYMPFAMYFTAYCPNVFCRSLSPFNFSPQAGDSLAETAASTITMTITQTSSTYYDLGFYYEFQNLNLGQIATGGHSITITGSGNWGVNIWLNPGGFVWGPTGNPSVENFGGLGSGSYGLGPTATTTATISASTSFFLVSAAGTCLSGSTHTAAELVSVCGLSGTTPFALWIGVTGPSAPGSVTATISSIYSTPYP
jgi:hypothetical protein